VTYLRKENETIREHFKVFDAAVREVHEIPQPPDATKWSAPLQSRRRRAAAGGRYPEDMLQYG
jgi:hypothetical protein